MMIAQRDMCRKHAEAIQLGTEQDDGTVNIALEAALHNIDRLHADRKYSEVVAACTEATIRFPDEAQFYYRRAQAKLGLGDANAAIRDLDEAILRNSAEPTLFYFRGLWSIDTGCYVRAVADLEYAVMLDAAAGSEYYTEPAQLACAVANLHLGHFSAALACISEKALETSSFVAGGVWTVAKIRDYASRRQKP
jgi:tetratricopeptide (TPR) repeat protein